MTLYWSSWVRETAEPQGWPLRHQPLETNWIIGNGNITGDGRYTNSTAPVSSTYPQPPDPAVSLHRSNYLDDLSPGFNAQPLNCLQLYCVPNCRKLFPFYLFCPSCFFPTFFLLWSQFSLLLAMTFTKDLSPPFMLSSYIGKSESPPLTGLGVTSCSLILIGSAWLFQQSSVFFQFTFFPFSNKKQWLIPLYFADRSQVLLKSRSFHSKCLNTAWPRAAHSHSCRVLLRHGLLGTEHPQ